MSSARLVWRSFAAIAVTGTVFSTLLVAWIFTFPSARLRRPIHRVAFRNWSRVLCRILGIKVAVVGDPPSPPCFLVSNHLSYIDVLVIASVVPSRFVAKSEVRDWPGIGWMCRSVETIFIDRSSRRDAHRTNSTIREGLEVGDSIVVFPEGTSSSGYEVAPFRAPLLAPAAELGLPVHYVALRYEVPGGKPPAHLAVCWWGETPFGPHLRGLLAVPRIEAQLAFGPEPKSDRDRKVLAAKLHRAVTAIFSQTVSFEPIDPTPET